MPLQRFDDKRESLCGLTQTNTTSAHARARDEYDNTWAAVNALKCASQQEPELKEHYSNITGEILTRVLWLLEISQLGQRLVTNVAPTNTHLRECKRAFARSRPGVVRDRAGDTEDGFRSVSVASDFEPAAPAVRGGGTSQYDIYSEEALPERTRADAHAFRCVISAGPLRHGGNQ